MPVISPRLGTGKTPGSWMQIKDPILRRKEYVRQYRAMKYEKEKQDPRYVETSRRRTAEWVKKNTEKHLKNCKSWRLKNRDKVVASSKAANIKFKALYPEKVLAYSSRRRAIKNDRLHPNHNFIKEMEIRKEAIKISRESGIPHAIDHIIPLSKGGWHHHENLQILPSSINSSKNATLIWESGMYKTWRDVPEFLWPEQLVQELKKQNKL